jgi:hypothetical protein
MFLSYEISTLRVTVKIRGERFDTLSGIKDVSDVTSEH